MKVVNHKSSLIKKKSFKRYLVISSLSLAFLFVVTAHAVADNASQSTCPDNTQAGSITTVANGTVKAIAADQSSLQIQCNGPKPATISVKKPELKAILKGFSIGDLVNIDYNSAKELTSLSVETSPVHGVIRFVTLVGTGLSLYVLTFVLVSWITKKNLNDIFVGQDNRLSNSKSQMAIWFFVLLVGYISLNVLRAINGGLGFVGGVSIPQNLLLLSGLSALTYGGAKVITQSQIDNKPGSKKVIDSGDASLTDFVTDDDGRMDFGDLQMSFITLLAVVVYLLQLYNFLGAIELHSLVTLPDVDTTILSIFGLSQGAYITKKAAVAAGAKEPLKIGVKSEEVKKLKAILNEKLKQAIPPITLAVADDNFDQDTENAVKKFQEDNTITGEDGFVGPKTREKLGL
jgi:hypothetical protein